MRLDWQCPICFGELGDRSHARMLTCPYCGTLLIVNSEKREFRTVKKDVGWYFFRKRNIGDFSGYLRSGNGEEYYRYRDGMWYLKMGNEWYILRRGIECDLENPVNRGEVEHIWGELPILAPPKSVIWESANGRFLCRKVSGQIYIFEKIEK